MAPFTRWMLALLFLSLPLSVAVSQESEQTALVSSGFVNAEDYLKFDQNSQAVYAAGLIDGMYLAPVFDAPNSDKYLTALKTCVHGMTNTQVAAIITKWTKDHPEKWHVGTNVAACHRSSESVIF
jgi:hypothetical protein